MKNKTFNDLKNHWYKKLKDEGFEDQEHFYYENRNEFRETPYLQSSRSMRQDQQHYKRAKISSQAYNSYQNYLVHGPFYPNLHVKYQEIRHLDQKDLVKVGFGRLKANCAASNASPQASKPQTPLFAGSQGTLTFSGFLASQEVYWNETETIAFQLYIDGFTYREISDELRRLYKQNRLSTTYRDKYRKRLPYSLFYVQKLIPKIRAASDRFNSTAYEGSNVYEAERQEAWEDGPEANQPVKGL